jgi:hypothetical protein
MNEIRLDSEFVCLLTSETENVSQDEQNQLKSNEEAANVEAEAGLTKQSCHDSGIDIRDANVAPAISKQKVKEASAGQI